MVLFKNLSEPYPASYLFLIKTLFFFALSAAIEKSKAFINPPTFLYTAGFLVLSGSNELPNAGQ
jgi:hypothetical protein